MAMFRRTELLVRLRLALRVAVLDNAQKRTGSQILVEFLRN